MRVEKRPPLPRWVAPAVVAALVIATVAVVGGLWFLRGRGRLPLRVTLAASRYVVGPGERVTLRAQLLPASSAAKLRIVGLGVGTVKGAEATFTAPGAGLHTITASARLSGTTAEDRITIQVLEAERDEYKPLRPLRTSPPELDCDRPSKLKVVVRGRPCRGANLVVEVEAPSRGGASAERRKLTTWHTFAGNPSRARSGRIVNLRLPLSPSKQRLILRTVIAGDGGADAGCGVVETPIAIEDCRSGPEPGALFADFRWQRIGPGDFRFIATPSRGRQPFDRFEWHFGDERIESKTTPVVMHRYETARPFWIVRLRVFAGQEVVETVRVISDRSPHELER